MRRTLTIFFVLYSLAFTFTGYAKPYDNIVVFGDSLSDQGNLVALSKKDSHFKNFPYHEGRLTDGNTAVEVLAKALDLNLKPAAHEQGNNYAVIGARASLSGTDLDQIALSVQVGDYLNTNKTASAKTLYVFTVGSNDIRAARDTHNEKIAYAILTEAAAMVESNVKTLINAGAKNILIVNAPNLGRIPETMMLAAKTNNPSIIDVTESYTHTYNIALKRAIRKLRRTEDYSVEVRGFNLFRYFITLQRRALHRMDFINATEACFLRSKGEFSSMCSPEMMNDFVFFDEAHPSARAHEAIGQAMRIVLPDMDYHDWIDE